MTTPNGHYFLNQLPRFSDFKDASVFEQRQFGPTAEDHIFALYLDEIYHFGKDAGLEVIDLKLYNNILTSGHMKLGNILKYLPHYFVKILEKITTRLPLYFRKKIHDCVAVLYHRKS